MNGCQLWGLSTLSSREKKLGATLAYSLFGVLSAHLVLVAAWLAISQHAQAPLFGQWEAVSELKLGVWIAFLSYCGVNGLLGLTLESKRAARHALICWLVLTTIHVWHLTVDVTGNTQDSWTKSEMLVQLLTDSMAVGFLALHLRRRVTTKDDFMREPLLSIIA
ncbi:hypothetical protein V7S43_017873 [Phytophthora oleae]|uniref:Uncharacterized protein n=1 Tax=Phytophthora oleae TaxID=2107226 RepID=A0ABD3ES06_9STRA